MKWNAKNIITILFFAGLLTLLIKELGKEPVTWEDSFNVQEDLPYGSKYVFQSLEHVAPDKNISINRLSINQGVKSGIIHDNAVLIINDDFNPTELELESIIKSVKSGSEFFISAYNFNDLFLNKVSENIRLKSFSYAKDSCSVSDFNKNKFTIANRQLKYFKDNAKSPLGFIDDDKVNWISLTIGEGDIHIHLAPNTFTNYHLLKEESVDYLTSVFNSIEHKNIVWNTYYNPKMDYKASSPFYVIFKNRGLKAALQFSVFTTLLFMLFGMKRRQRVIPIIQPLKNQSLEFAKNIGLLNKQQNNHKANIEDLKQLLKKDIHHRFKLHYSPDAKFYERLAGLSGCELGWIQTEVAFLLRLDTNNATKSDFERAFRIYQKFKKDRLR